MAKVETTASSIIDEQDLIYSFQEKLKILGEERIELQQKQKELDDEFEKLGNQITSVREAMYQLERKSHLNDALTPFVTTIEIADQYFDLKNHVRQNYNFKNTIVACRIAQTLLKDHQKLMLKFNKIGEPEILTLSYSLVLECLSGGRTKKEDDCMQRNPIYKLVFQTREEGYVMDPNPIVELEKIMNSHPNFYDEFFVFLEPSMDCKEKLTSGEVYNEYSEFRLVQEKLTSGEVHNKYSEFRLVQENLTSEEVHNKYSEFRLKNVKAATTAETAVEKDEAVVDLCVT